MRATGSAPAGLSSASGLTVQLLSRADEFDALRSEYQQLNDQSLVPLPFTLFEWQKAWCDHFLAAGSSRKDSLFLYVARTADGRCVAIVPLVSTVRTFGPFRSSSLGLLGADRALTEIRVPLIAPGYQVAVAKRIQRELVALGRWDWIQWTGGPFFCDEVHTTSSELRTQPVVIDYVLDLPGDWETFRGGLKRNVRESLRHCYNSLKRENLECSLVTLRKPQEIQVGLDHFLRLHSMRAQLTRTVMHPNYFATPGAEAFLRDVAGRLAQRNVTRLYQLVVNGKIVASRIGFLMGDHLYLYYSGFDPSWARYSVMTTTLAEIIKAAIHDGLKSVNLSPGTDVSKTRWGPREVRIESAVRVARHPSARVARRLYEHITKPQNKSGWLANVLGQRSWS